MSYQPQRSTLKPFSKRSLQRLAITATLLGMAALTPLSAWSISVGGMRVQSALGEPLRAQISLGQLTAEELSSINAGFAPAAVYQAAGISANPILNNVQISIDASAPSNVVVNLTSSSPINEPFLDMLLEIKWASGRVVRDYTLLFNPATAAAPVVSTDPVIAAAPAVSDPAMALPVEPVAAPSNIATGTVTEPAGEPVAAVEAPIEPVAAPATGVEIRPAAKQRLRVVRGDTAAALAQANLPSGVSLDQMLQAMLRANPNAFVDNNVNRLKAGAQLTVPTADEAQSIDTAQARRLVIAQSKDFNAYRRSLAANAPKQAVGPASQVASGQIQTQVQDKAATAPVADQLTLSKGSVATGTEAEAQIAAARQARDEQAQQADLARNIDDLKALAQAAPGTGTEGTAPADSSSAPTVTAAPETPLAPKPDNAVESLASKPWALPAAFGLLAVLLALLILRLNRRKTDMAAPLAEPAQDPAANDHPLTDAPAASLNFNLSDINLELNQPTNTDGANAESLFTKFELAKEFLSLGDRVAAKALAEEVQADATGLLKRRAELFLADLG